MNSREIRIFAAGSNAFSQIKTISNPNIVELQDITDEFKGCTNIIWLGLFDTALHIDGELVFHRLGFDISVPCVSHPRGTAISKGFGMHSLLGYLDEEGYAWSLDGLKLLGQWKDIACTSIGSTMCIDMEGYLHLNNSYHEFANGVKEKTFTTTRFKSVTAGAGHFILLSNHGKVYALGDNRYKQSNPNSNAINFIELSPLRIDNPVLKISCGAFHSAVLTSDGQMVIWGKDSDGQCGGLDPMKPWAPQGERILDLSLGWYHSLIVTTHKIYASGNNKYSQTGGDLIILNETEFTEMNVPSPSERSKAHCGPYSSYIIYA